jgi:FMN phosphatase YigB (HAD superfamily)
VNGPPFRTSEGQRVKPTPWWLCVFAPNDSLLSDRELILPHRYRHNIALLRELRGAGYLTGLATLSHSEQARRVLSILRLTDAFDVIATRDDVEYGKPDSEIDLLVARELEVKPEDCLVIEDSLAGSPRPWLPAWT